jgi:uncharacterized Zn finger protein (UPF0148 family)
MKKQNQNNKQNNHKNKPAKGKFSSYDKHRGDEGIFFVSAKDKKGVKATLGFIGKNCLFAYTASGAVKAFQKAVFKDDKKTGEFQCPGCGEDLKFNVEVVKSGKTDHKKSKNNKSSNTNDSDEYGRLHGKQSTKSVAKGLINVAEFVGLDVKDDDNWEELIEIFKGN